MLVLGAVLSDGFYSGVKGQGKVVIVEVVVVLVLLLKYQYYNYSYFLMGFTRASRALQRWRVVLSAMACDNIILISSSQCNFGEIK